MCFDGDTPIFYHERIVKGRKDHKCSACKQPIAQGERHLCGSGAIERGELYDFRVCRRCCYDTLRVVSHELAEGCDYGAWPKSTAAASTRCSTGATSGGTTPQTFAGGWMPG